MILPSIKGSPAYRIYQLTWIGLDWLYPPLCAGCGTSGSRWCVNCQKNTHLIRQPVCLRCGVEQHEPCVCNHCRQSPPLFKGLRSWSVFEGPVRSAVHRLKYKRDLALGDTFARPLLELFLETGWEIDLVIPVPLGIARQAERGYNQASLLARPLALGLGVKYLPQALKKIKETPSQVGLNVLQRRENVKKAFLALRSFVQGRKVLIVDDVCTSGATLDECSKALIEADVLEVYAITLARAHVEFS